MEEKTKVSPTVTKDELTIALLENNAKIVNQVNTSIEKNVELIKSSVRDQTEPMIKLVTELAKDLGTLSGRIVAVETKVNTLWSKIGAVVAFATIIGSAIGIFIEYLISKH